MQWYNFEHWEFFDADLDLIFISNANIDILLISHFQHLIM